MSDKFILKIQGVKVDLSDVKGGIKRESIKDETMLSIFDAFDKEGGQKDGILSDTEVSELFGMLKKRAKKHNPKNLGNREYKKLIKNFKENGIEFDENISKEKFLDFISNLNEVSKNQEQPAEETSQDSQTVVPEEDPQTQQPQRKNKPEVIEKVAQPRVWQNSNPTEAIASLNVQEDYNADKVLEKLLSTYGIKPEEIQMDKLKADLIKYNPSIFDSEGNVYIDAEWEKLDFPANAGELYKNGVQTPVVEAPVIKEGGNEGGDARTPAVQAVADGKFQSDSIKVTVPKAEHSTQAKRIQRFQREGASLHDAVKRGDVSNIKLQTVAYAFNDDVHFGPNSKDAAKKVFEYLVQRMIDLKIFEYGKDYGSYSSFSKTSFAYQDKLLHEYRNRIVVKERDIIRKDNERVKKANAERTKQQKVLDEANEFLVNAANNAGKLKAGAFEKKNNGEQDYITLKLDGGKYIRVFLDANKQILEIEVGSNFGKDNQDSDVCYNAERAYVDTNHNNEDFEGNFKSIHNFDKHKELAQEIFGKYIN